MKEEVKNLQVKTLNMLHDTGFKVDMDLNLWRPDRKCIDAMFSLEGFSIDPNNEADTTSTICSFNNEGLGRVHVTMFVNDADATHLHKKIKQRREVSK